MASRTRAHSVAFVFERIVVGYAGDRAGRDGVLLASRLAALTHASVTVAFPYHPLFATVPADVAEERARGELQAMLGTDPMLERARFRWCNSSWPIRALHELAEYEAAELIVFGAAPERLGRRHVDLMERMVHGAPCAVAVAPDRYTESPSPAIRRIGVGFADTAEGRAAVAAASELAQLTGEPLEIISGSGLTGALASYAAMSAALPEAEREMYEEAMAASKRIASEVGNASVEVHPGEPARVLLDSARTLDLLVLGSRGYGPLRHALLGGVSAEVMRNASCPVLVMPRRGDEERRRTRRRSRACAAVAHLPGCPWPRMSRASVVSRNPQRHFPGWRAARESLASVPWQPVISALFPTVRLRSRASRSRW